MKTKTDGSCNSLACHNCRHYIKFLSISTMHMICWNKGYTEQNVLLGM